MRFTPRTSTVAVIGGLAWAAALDGAILAANGTPATGHLLVALDPATSALAATLTVSLVVWSVLGPLVVVWRMAKEAGREAVVRESVRRRQEANVRELYPAE